MNQSNRDVVRTWKCAQAFPGLVGAPPYHMSLCFRCKNEEGLGVGTGRKCTCSKLQNNWVLPDKSNVAVNFSCSK